jgi:hypothetical protein
MINKPTCGPRCRIVPPQIIAGIIEYGTEKQWKVALQTLQLDNSFWQMRAGG